MTSALHDAIWEAVPADAVPEELALRLSFLLANVPRGAAVLDLGCGAGEFSAALAKAGAEVIAVDVAGEALRRARNRVANLDARLWRDGEPLPVEDGAVDVVWAGEVIEHVADVAPWLSEVRRVLRPGGTLLVTTPHHGPTTLLVLALRPRRFQRHFDPRNDHVRFYSPVTLGRLLDDLGFDVVELRPAGGRIGLRSTILARAVKPRARPPRRGRRPAGHPPPQRERDSGPESRLGPGPKPSGESGSKSASELEPKSAPERGRAPGPEPRAN